MHWIEVSVEDGRGNPTALRLATSARGIKILVPTAAASSVLHVVGNNIGTLVDQVNRLGHEAHAAEPTTGPR